MDHGPDPLLATVAAAIALGILAQGVAERLKLPAILPLLVFGILAGTSPYGLGWVDPAALGHGLDVFIHLGVAIILFEGGLSLDLRQLAKVGGAVGNLLTLGVAVTWVGSAVLAHFATAVPWQTAILFGAIVTVTGPTVIAPLLRHLVAPREVKTVLLSEGLMVDPIGAVLAYLVLQWIARAEVPVRGLAGEMTLLFVTGIVLGFAGGSLARFVATRRRVSAELRNLAILAVLVLCYLAAEAQAPQSGILASLVMGATVSALGIPDVVPIKAFKGQLTTLFISVLFVLLSAQLDLPAMIALGGRGLLVAAGLILVVRPLAVAASVWTKSLGWRERTVLALTAPRGVVAAAVGSLAARQLDAAPGGTGGGAVLESLIYLVIFVSGAWATAAAVILPRLLGYRSDPSRRLTVIVGATPLSHFLANELGERGRTTLVIDSAAEKLRALQRDGIQTWLGDARDVSTYEEAGVEADTVVLALTPNDELNLVAADLVHEEFGVEHPVVALQRPSEEIGTRRKAWIDVLGGRGVDLPRWIRRLEDGRARFVTVPLADDEPRQTLRRLARELESSLVIACGWKGSQPRFAKVLETLEEVDGVTILVEEGDAVERLEALLAAAKEPAPETAADDAVAAPADGAPTD